MSQSRELPVTVGHYSIDIVAKDPNTYSIQIFDKNDQTILSDLPLDPVDHTLAGVINKNLPVPVLEALAKVLHEQIGAKEFIVLPAGSELPGHIPAQNAEFKRVRQASRGDLEKTTSVILDKYQDLAAKLDKEYEIVSGMDTLTKKLHKPYEVIPAFLKEHADFTAEKMAEYLQGIKPRFNNSNVTTMAILNEHGLCGLVRSLAMGSKFAYLSDETLNQEILPLENFQGYTHKDKFQNRAIFLLAYLVNRMAALVKDQDHFVMIAASGRESIYEAVGFQTFPIKGNDYVVTLKLGSAGPLLKSIKEKLNQASFASALNKFGLNAPSTPEPEHADEVKPSFLRT